MNYIKAQQDLLLDVFNTPRGVGVYHDAGKEMTLFINSAATVAYLIPDSFVAIDVAKCTKLHRFPFPSCPPDASVMLTPPGETAQRERRTLLKFNATDRQVYIDKKLVDKFGKNVNLYQDNRLGIVTVAEWNGNDPTVVGYVCPFNFKTN